MRILEYPAWALAAAVLISLGVLCSFAEATVGPDLRKYDEEAYLLALPAAQVGDATAQYRVGYQLLRGLGVARDDTAAAQWFARAAEQNHPGAMNDLALLYQGGVGVEKDETRAYSLLAKAADMGHLNAQFNRAQALQAGVGVRKNLLHARYWYERADATEAAEIRSANAVRGKPPNVLPDGCRPTYPPRQAMRQQGVTTVTGMMAAYIDDEGRIRGVTERDIPVDALKYDAVGLFSVSLRSSYCVLPAETRNVGVVIPFRFDLK